MPEQTSVAREEPQRIDWESVKMLALEVGVREAARKLGLSEERVKKRCTLDGWLSNPSARRIAQQAVQQRNLPVPQVSPSAALHAELLILGSKTKLGIAKGLARAGEVIGEMGGVQVIDNAHEIKSVAQTASIVHNWDKSQGVPKIRLELLAEKGEVSAIEVESEIVARGEWEE